MGTDTVLRDKGTMGISHPLPALFYKGHFGSDSVPLSRCLVGNFASVWSFSRNPAVTGPSYHVFKDFSREDKLHNFNSPNWKDEWGSLPKFLAGRELHCPPPSQLSSHFP